VRSDQGQSKSGQEKVRFCQNRSFQVRSRQDRLGHVRSGKDKFWSGQVRSCQDRSDYVMSRQAQINRGQVKFRLC